MKIKTKKRQRKKRHNIQTAKKQYHVKSHKKKKRHPDKSTRSQSGGMLVPIIAGIGLALGSALAYSGYNIMNKVKDKSDILALIQQPLINYLPKVNITETKEYLTHYMDCIDTTQFIQLLLLGDSLLRSRTIHGIIVKAIDREYEEKRVES